MHAPKRTINMATTKFKALLSVGINSLVACLPFLVNHVLRLVRTRITLREKSAGCWHRAANPFVWHSAAGCIIINCLNNVIGSTRLFRTVVLSTFDDKHIGRPISFILTPHPLIHFHQLHTPVRSNNFGPTTSQNCRPVGEVVGLGLMLMTDTSGNTYPGCRRSRPGSVRSSRCSVSWAFAGNSRGCEGPWFPWRPATRPSAGVDSRWVATLCQLMWWRYWCRRPSTGTWRPRTHRQPGGGKMTVRRELDQTWELHVVK